MTTQQSYYYGTGKRKSAIARVRLYPGGTGAMVINGKTLEEALPWLDWQKRASQPFDSIPAASNRFNVVAKIEGGGISSWADALRHGISRALLVADPSLKSELRKNGFLTRDSRIKESKKYGLKRARRAPQYTKR
ncbi:MAG: 30S ribosomal protein S9 [Chloroflexi bacterium]|jgi:small subunit ribosomal protein S9|nr:30S ribosomal protein S9 [Chloroflexota bacterium]MCH2532283.1 30S ribosomal protein S9 [Dehalococcoidia bacterium]HCH35782.1 30S ribosomal protein S9 [Dehalococcoidia bacterium]|tara:strand:- start:14227 stop:14631 length:405 start_codon:yes stop_codon:yes gene_type:complete